MHILTSNHWSSAAFFPLCPWGGGGVGGAFFGDDADADAEVDPLEKVMKLRLVLETDRPPRWLVRKRVFMGLGSTTTSARGRATNDPLDEVVAWKHVVSRIVANCYYEIKWLRRQLQPGLLD